MARSKGLSTLEKCLIFLFVAMTTACISLLVVYFVEKADSSTHIDGGASGVIHLWFEEFALEDTQLCTGDFVTLRDALGTIGKYCGYTKPKPVVSLTNHLTVYFDTNERKTDQGFKAHYKAVAPELAPEIAGAGGFLQGDQGDVMTPSFSEQNYPNGALYQWRITVPEGERVRLQFISFDLVPDACGDFVQVYDGSNAGSSLLGKFCGGTMPKPLESSGNTMVDPLQIRQAL
ncbi:Bone morphogenetic protein 1-like protein [Larimichthys crocea]|uniref:Bone morphogenetic protein 1-like protein n=1 Tax=Larimichthys crocea TaxID=215358 RepID=A0A6G0J963_LARCR|nr:Bone morphogenetic protein 1-like protein [Larimichthys crocea]